MDQFPRGNEGFANSNNLFADSQQFNAYDNLFQTGADQNSYDASWGLNASAQYPASSRVQNAPAPSWPQNANHLSTHTAHANINGEPSPYARSLSHSPSPYGQNAFNTFGATQNFPYGQPQYDPALVPPHAFNQNFNYSTTDYQTQYAGTIAPHALQNETRSPGFVRSPYEGQLPVNNGGAPRSIRPSLPEFVDPKALASAIPKGHEAGYFSIINFDDLSKVTNSERMGNFLNIGKEAQNWDVNRAALPNYVPRKSRKELRKIAGSDPKLLAKLSKKSLKKERAMAKVAKPLHSSTDSTSAEKIKYDGDSSSEEESSSEDDEGSSYTSDDDSETSPLPAKRPSDPKGATEYDTIKALWRGKRRNLGSESIRKALGDFWEIVKTIRDRWKADQAAYQEAESKNRKNELPLLESRVKDQRDMLEAAFKAAHKHGHRTIVELLAENVSLIFLCYQFLLDREKVKDFNSALPRIILETMTMFTTITDEKLEKTHLVKVLPRYVKNGDAKTQFYAKRVLANAAAGSKEKQAEAPAKKVATKDGNAASPPSKRTEPEPVAGVKRPASALGDGGAQKKTATTSTKTDATISKQNGVVKKTSSATDNAKPSTTPATTVKSKQVVAKPSGLFSSLQSAGKKPGTSSANKAGQTGATAAGSKPSEKATSTNISAGQNAAPKSTFSFAETMANLSKPKEEKPAPKQEKSAPTETPEQKAKRLRKESRRHLHVAFKTGDELVQIRVFQHDPEEELGHDASQMRDVADVGGEGRMFKQQHQMMDVDDDEDATEEEQKLIEFFEPQEVEFSDVDPEDRKRNFAPYGGGESKPKSPERAVREHHEANTLIVFYTDVNDIPPNPREPSDPYHGEQVNSVKNFGAPEEKWSARARQKKYGRTGGPNQPPQPAMQNNLPAGFDLSKLANYSSGSMSQQSNQHQPQNQAAAPAPASDSINNILASLKQAQQNQPTPPPPPAMSGYGSAPAPPPPMMNSFPNQQPAAPPSGQPDLAAILAQITQNQPGAAQPPPMAGFGFGAPTNVPNMGSYGQPQQSTTFENPDRKKWREGGGGENNMSRTTRQNPAHNPYYRTKVCKYWQEGRCQKGDGCTYKHSED